MQRLIAIIRRHPLCTRLLVAAGLCLFSMILVVAIGVRLAWPAHARDAGHVTPLVKGILLAATLLSAGGAGWALATARRTFGSLETLRQAANLLSAGQRDVALPIDGGDEIGSLARALSEMAAANAASYREVEEQNRNLERIVRMSTEELRHKNLALAFQNEKVNEANKLKSAFLASVSHELRTPLNAILALSEMLRDQISGPLGEEQVKQASMIYRSGENLLELINQVLDLSKIESGRMEVRRDSVRIVDVLAEAASGLRPLAEEKGLIFEVSTEGEGVEVQLDGEKLRQVFVNLLGNAIKFTQRGKVHARIRLLQEENMLFVEVEDTGPGIAPEHHHLVFQEFHQLERAVAGNQGSGLGLAISRRLVNLLGGDIWIDSDTGKGARFTFVVPLAALEESDGADAPRTDEWGPSGGARRGQQRVLVIDDDVVEAGVLSRYLRRQGLEVTTVLDGIEAISLLRREPVDLVVLDLLAEGDEAFQLLERMRQHPRLAGVPVVVNSSRELSDTELSLLKPKVQSIFVKGTRGVGDLIAEVTDALHGSSAPQAVGVHEVGLGGLEEVA